MAEPARIYDEEQDEGKKLTALERAHQSWGMSSETPSADGLQTAEENPDNVTSLDSERQRRQSNKGNDSESEAKKSDNDIPFKNDSDEERTVRGRILNRKTAIGGGIAGLIIAGVVGIMSVVSGPLGLIQFSQLLQRFHFSNSSNFNDTRLSHLVNYGRGRAYRNNLGKIGNAVTDKIDKRLRAGGIELEYSRTGNIKAAHIDVDKQEGKRLLTQLKAQGIEVDMGGLDLNNRRVTIDLSRVSDLKTARKVTGGAVDSIGKSGITGAVSRRLLKLRANAGFHPLENISRKAGESLKDYYKRIHETRDEKIRNGAEAPSSKATQDAPTTDENGDPIPVDPDAEAKAAAQASEVSEILGDSGIDSTSTSTIRKGLVSKFAIGGAIGVGAISLVCGLHQLGDSVAVIQHANVVLPLIRLGVEMTAVGSQIQSGQDVDIEQVGAIASTLYDDGGEIVETLEDVNGTMQETTVTTKPSSAFSAASIQAQKGEEPTGAALPNSSKAGKDKPEFFKVIDTVVDAFPGGNQACNFVNSTVGGWFISAVDVGITAFTGGLSKAVASGVGEVAGNLLVPTLLGGFIEDLTHTLAGTAVDVTSLAGGPLGAAADAGAFLANNDSMMSMGGTELSPQQSAALRSMNEDVLQQQFAQKSLATRLFDPYETKSLFSVALLQNQNFASFGQVIGSLIRAPAGLFSMLARSASSLTSSKVLAFESIDPSIYYGVPEYGFGLEDIDNELVENPYLNADYITDHPEIVDKYQECFGTTISDSGSLVAGVTKRYDQIPEKCRDGSSDLLRYRFYLADTITAKSMACYEGIDETACTELGFSRTGSTGTPGSGPGIIPGQFIWPVPSTEHVSACWNDDRTGYKEDYFHSGLDIGSDNGDPVVATADGTVRHASDDDNGTGLTLIIEHANGIYSQYQHLQEILIPIGQTVKQGEVVAKADDTGFSTDPHLHFNLQKTASTSTRSAQTLNPLDYLADDGRNMASTRGSFAPPELRGKTVKCVPSSIDARGWVVVE